MHISNLPLYFASTTKQSTMQNNNKLEVTFSENQYWELCKLLRRMQTNTENLKIRSEKNNCLELADIYKYELEQLQKFVNILDQGFSDHLNSLKSN